METKVTLSILKDELSYNKKLKDDSKKSLISAKKRHEQLQTSYKARLQYIQDLENDIKLIQEEEAK